eukprot:CAMPEP_0204568556 /NCGR_PEP_ID=MMETSP0661-20131031/37255_1 /ASSEMBLY_ACC=CAM_ASM_000606 /TAXON_ID=109239 /ORGANISM="Alexandrium margalefi, Strain AMGDE01CS-322" /LENGTH=599 /DNA_ID=CAMNT_0051576595 /DNA_START=77 /DNA_END=1874 /DNA_ORIENTATION=+
MAMARRSALAVATASVLFLSLGIPGGASTGARFRGSSGEAASLRVETQEVEFGLRSSLEALLRGGEGPTARRLGRIEALLWETFQALPKNSAGRLAPRAVRYLVHGYFAKEHGWLIKGLEPHGMHANMSEVHEVSILQDRAPALVQALLEAREPDRGLSLDDVVVMVAALERLIFDESIQLLEAAYSLNYLSADGPLDEEELHEILQSYLLVFQMGMRGNLSDARKHQAIKRKLARTGSSWRTVIEFEEDAVRNFGFAQQHQTNPFVAPQYTFQAASDIVEHLAQDYGKWQNADCRQMKEELIKLDVNGDGRVPLGSFYSQPNTATYQFAETQDYLRTIGALDETVSGAPRIRIANYMLGPSNCIASSSYYSVCCLSECEAIMHEVEGRILGPMAPAARLLGVVANLTSSSYAPEAPRLLPQDLKEKMHAIAERHGGEVPLHGRLFAQWLHSAFPQECPYPHVHESAAVLSPGHWLDARDITASEEERARTIEQGDGAAEEAHSVAEAQPQALEWSDDEVLPLQEPPQPAARRAVARLAVQLVSLLAVLRAAYAGFRTVAGAAGADSQKKGSLLPVHIEAPWPARACGSGSLLQFAIMA